jgi:hypothetical protein
MDKELKEKWVAALRSGEYTQARGVLVEGPKCLCCIGVGYVTKNGLSRLRIGDCDTRKASNDLGLSYNDEFTLLEMNDGEKKSFVEIADYIEANL